jgi:nucleotide-binding universal stress UspA family protein
MILCATDLSASAESATGLARWLARRFDAPILLLHVLEPIPVVVPEAMAANTDWLMTMRGAAESQLELVAGELRAAGARVETLVVLGEPGAMIVETARQRNARFITMGTHGRKGAARLFLGSVAERVSTEAPCPVVVTRPAVAGASRWPATRALNLAVATDGSPLGQAAIDWVGELQRLTACELTVIRVYAPSREAARYGLEDPWVGRQAHPQLAQWLERDLRRSLGKVGEHATCRVRLVASTVDPVEDLATELTLLQPDALVLGVAPHRMTWPDLPASAVLRTSPVPVICIPASARPTPQIFTPRSALVPTDLGPSTTHALATAYGLLRAHGGRVELCTVHDQGPAPAARPALVLPLDDQHRQKLEAELRAFVSPQAEAFGVVTRASVVEGHGAAGAILAAAERLGVDLIVMASRGRSGIKRAVLGSVAEEVVRHARVPVVIVHDPIP